VVRGGVEPPTHGFSVREQTTKTAENIKNPQAHGGKNGGSQNETPTDLQAVIDAWPTLPEALRAGIVAMISSVGITSGNTGNGNETSGTPEKAAVP